MQKITWWIPVLAITVLYACSSRKEDVLPVDRNPPVDTPGTTPKPPVVDTPVTPPATPVADAPRKTDSIVAAYMEKYNVPGITLAITKNGKLVYAKGYGYANKETGDKVTTASLFRIASVSKGITAAAVMKLAEDGKLKLDDKIFGAGAILGAKYGTQPYKQYITDLTVRQLLQHAGGGWPNGANDPTFTNQSMTADQFLSWVLDNRPLDAAPGTTYMYSNVGYFILGRVIEAASGTSYQEYVKANILAPCGITDMRIGGSTLADRQPDEVKYYGVDTENPYAWNIPRRDANGGWIASATSLMRLLTHIDGLTTVPDILNETSVQTMTTPSFTNLNYACGWYIGAAGKWFHDGVLPGSRSFWMRTSTGMNGAIICNTSAQDLREVLEKVIGMSDVTWPDQDLFK